MSDWSLPPFHLPAGEDEDGKPYSDLFALAFVRGEYADPGGTEMRACFSVIYLRPPGARHRFCIASVNKAGRFFNTSNPGVGNVDQMLLWAWDENGVHPAEWTLYGEEAEGVAERITDSAARRSYLDVARGAMETVDLFYRRRSAKRYSQALAVKRNLPTSATLPLFRFMTGRERSTRPLPAWLAECPPRPGTTSSESDAPAV